MQMPSTFRSHERLRRPADFSRAFRQGRARTGRWLKVWAFHRPGGTARAARLGVVVSRKNGPAVRRNRFKRRLREIFRLNKSALPRGWDFVALAKNRAGPPGAFPASFHELCGDFLFLARQLTKP